MSEHPAFRRVLSPYRKGTEREKVYYYFCGILPVHRHLTEEEAEACWQGRQLVGDEMMAAVEMKEALDAR